MPTVALLSSRFSKLRNAFKYSVFEASKLVSTKTLLLKHYYRRQGIGLNTRFLIMYNFVQDGNDGAHAVGAHVVRTFIVLYVVDRPSTVLESTVSSRELSEILALTQFRKKKRELSEFRSAYCSRFFSQP